MGSGEVLVGVDISSDGVFLTGGDILVAESFRVAETL